MDDPELAGVKSNLPRWVLLMVLGLAAPSFTFLLVTGLLKSFGYWVAPAFLMKTAISVLCISMLLYFTMRWNTRKVNAWDMIEKWVLRKPPNGDF